MLTENAEMITSTEKYIGHECHEKNSSSILVTLYNSLVLPRALTTVY